MTLFLEKYGPAGIAAMVIVAALLWHDTVVAFVGAHKLSLDGLYNAVFGWSAIQCGFVFAVYGFVVGSQGTFIEKIRDTTPMNLFLKYTKNATWLSFALTLFSMVQMVCDPKLADGSFQYRAIIVWFGLFVWTFLAFARVAYLFGYLLRSRPKPLLPG